MKNNSLNKEIWKYFFVFSILILGILWIFQVLFLDQYYRYKKVKDITYVANVMVVKQDKKKFIDIINKAAYDKGVCIEIIDKNYETMYATSSYGRGCFTGKDISMNYKYNFIASDKKRKTYELINPRFNNDTLVYAVKLKDGYGFVNTSLDPIDSTAQIIQEQLVIVMIVVLILSFVISYFISNFISSPIVKINDAAKKLAKREFNVSFETDSNIRELNELADTLNYARCELNKTDELRRDLMANVSHDLKTPLTMIKAYAEMVRDLTYKDDVKREDNLNVIIEETDRLNLLVNDIIELTKINNDLQNLNITEFDLVELINSIINRFSIMDANFVFKNKSPIIVKADKIRIEQVIYNLIINAINYTGKDKKVIINLKENDKYVHVEIKDTGKGIDEEDLKLIWKRYYKVDKKYRREKKGSGIGLSIVENILKKHKFNYGVNSIKNKGTTFYFDIDKC